MFFTECVHLAERNPDLARTVQQIDAQLATSNADGVIRAADWASFLGADPNQVLAVLEKLAHEDLLLAEDMVECGHCRMIALHSEYQQQLEDEGEYRCTSCDRPLTDATTRFLTTYRMHRTSGVPKDRCSSSGEPDADARATISCNGDETQDQALVYRCFTNENPRGQSITTTDCERSRCNSSRDSYDIFVDLLACKVWRKGRACGKELDGEGRSTGKQLGEKSVRLLGDYIKKPGFPMEPKQTHTYQSTSVESRSVAVRFAAIRRSIHGKQFLLHAASGANPGEGTYVFEPGDMTYCLVERIE